MKRIGLVWLYCLMAVVGMTQHPTLYTVSQLKEELGIFKTALQEAHPGLYLYHDSTYFDNEFRTLEQRLTRPLSEEAFFRLLNPLVAELRCGHTKWHRDGKPDDLFAFHQNGLFPLKLYFHHKKAYAVYAYGKSTLPVGTEIVSINGQTMPAIINQLMRQVIADGLGEAPRFRALGDRFAGYYVSFIGESPAFNIGYRSAPGGAVQIAKLASVNAATISMVEQQRMRPDSLQLSFPADSIALVRIPVFVPQEHGAPFEPFLSASFEKIKAAGARHLILDLRDNEGGLDRWGVLLYAWLTGKPFRYYDRLTVASRGEFSFRPYATLPDQYDQLKAFIKKQGDEYVFTMHPNLGDQEAQPQPYTGRLYVLQNGVSFSVTTEFTAVVRDQQRGLVIGEESGGTMAGNNSGGFAMVKLPHTKLTLAIPLLGYRMHLDKPYAAGRGIIPDHLVVPTVTEVINGKDVVLEKVLRVIQNGQ